MIFSLVFSHGEKTTSQGVNSSVRWSTLRPRQVASSQGIVLFKPIQISGRSSQQFEMVDVANFLVRVDCATRIPSAEQ
jgi:hypothetical protein